MYLFLKRNMNVSLVIIVHWPALATWPHLSAGWATGCWSLCSPLSVALLSGKVPPRLVQCQAFFSTTASKEWLLGGGERKRSQALIPTSLENHCTPQLQRAAGAIGRLPFLLTCSFTTGADPESNFQQIFCKQIPDAELAFQGAWPVGHHLHCNHQRAC